jgi:ATP phosphoribosyltransferase
MTAVTSLGSSIDRGVDEGVDAGRRLIRVAVPNKGALSDSASAMLREAGYRQRTDTKELVLLDEANGVEFFYLRPRDIAVYVGEGTLDVGITGRDMLLDSGAPVTEVLPLGFGHSRFRFAAPAGSGLDVASLQGMRIATSYAGLVGAYLAERGVTARLISLDGAVETAIRLGVADVVADVVETGTTLRQAGLELFGDPLLLSEAVLIRRRDVAVPDGLEGLERRLNGVLIARNYVMMDYDVADAVIDDACAITPGFEGPTVSPLAREGWKAVRALVPRRDAQQVMDDLWGLGARAILVTDIAACRF